jgi:hypothetical protein
MTRILVLATALALALLAPVAFAAAPEPITAGTAVWTTDGKVDIKVTWQGGACEAPGEATVEAGDETTIDEVTIPTAATAEVCTMQIVPVTYEGTIAVEKLTTTLSVMILAPDGQPVARGSIEIAKGEAPAS